MNGRADPAFRWHPAARLFGPDGDEAFAMPAPAAGGGVQADDPAAAGLAAVLAPVDPDLDAAACRSFAIRAMADGPLPETLPDAPAFETLTSGSSGQPRRILRAQSSWTASFAVNAGLFGLGPGRRLAVCGALRHSLSLYGALEGLHLGCRVDLLGGLRPDRQLAQLALHRTEVVYATPAQLRALCRGGVLPDLRLILCGGSKLDAALRADLALLAPAARLREF